jgi:glycosyltransferase involved in cell wall biosynthesis
VTFETQPRISIVIPAFNSARDIAVALDSVFAQSLHDIEVIVVNDGSDDTEMLEVALEPYVSRLHYLMQTNQGAGAARNAALRVARGEYIAFLDADDRWLPGFLSEQVGYLDAHAACGLVYCDAQITGESPLAGQAFSVQAPSDGPVTLLSLIQQTCNIPLSTVVMRRKDIVSAGLFDVSLRRGQDFELWLRLAARGVQMHCQKKVLAERRARLEGLSGTAVTEVRRALNVLERFGITNALDSTARSALWVRTSILHDRLAIEEAKQRIRELNFPAARKRLAATRHRGIKVSLALLGLRVAPRLLRRLYLLRRNRWPALSEPA